MRHCNLNYIATALLCVTSTCWSQGNDHTAIQFKLNDVNQILKEGNLQNIHTLIDLEEQAWIASPSGSYFDHMQTIAMGLRTDATDVERYWLFRKVIWKVLLKPIPPLRSADDIRKIMDCKTLLLSFARSAGRYNPNETTEMNSAIRHDTALMFLTFSAEVHKQIILDYRMKPVAAFNDPVGRRTTKENENANELQEVMRSALNYLARFHNNYLIEAYSQKPKNTEELIELLNALGISDRDRAIIMYRTQKTSR